MIIQKDTANNAFLISGIFDGTLHNGAVYVPMNGTSLEINERDIVSIKDAVSGDIIAEEKLSRVIYDGSPVTREDLFDIFDEIATEAGGGPGPEPEPQLDWFTITNLTANEGTVRLLKNNSPDNITLKVSNDGTNWTEYSNISATTDFVLPANGYLKFNGKTNDHWSSSDTVRWSFSATVSHKVSGNLNTLVGDTFTSKDCFNSLFVNDSYLSDASELVLPWLVLSIGCYSRMFQNCTSLTIAPTLPATTLANYCYQYMFNGCTSLTTTPALPATTLANNCYEYMFYRCSSLTSAAALPATVLRESCYHSMFENCTSLTSAPALPATILASSCYNSMFWSCSSLTIAPTLPATTLYGNCYNSMFRYCTSLTQAPALPAETTAPYCYSNMFNGCSSLTTAPILPAPIIQSGSYNGMFQNCSSLSYIKCLASNLGTPVGSNTSNWVDGVAASGTFECAAGISIYWPIDSVNGVPVGWTLIDPQPVLTVSPDGYDFGTITSAQTVSQTFTLSDLDPADTWSYTASDNNSYWSYSVSGNTLTVSLTVSDALPNGALSNSITFSSSGYTDKTMTVTADIEIPYINVTPAFILLENVGDTSTLTVDAPSFTYAVSGDGVTDVSISVDSQDTSVLNVEALAINNNSATITISAAGYRDTEAIVSLGDEVVGHGCRRVMWIQTNNNYEYINTGVLLAADCSVRAMLYSDNDAHGNWQFSTRWGNNQNDYTNGYYRIFDVGSTSGSTVYWDRVSDNNRFQFSAAPVPIENAEFYWYWENSTTNNTRTMTLTDYEDPTITKTQSTSGGTCNAQSYPLVLFSYLSVNYENWTLQTNGAAQSNRERLYKLDIWNDGVQVYDAIPAVRNVDDKPGLYDFVTHAFYPCGGTVDMTYEDFPTPGIDYFTITNLTNTDGSVYLIAQNYSNSLTELDFEVSRDGGQTWEDHFAEPTSNSLAVGLELALPANGSLKFYGENNLKFSTSSDVWKFGCDVDYAVSGSISTLVSPNIQNKDYVLQHLFANTYTIGTTHIVDASALKIDFDMHNATNHFNGMFDNCTSLTDAPILDASYISNNGYYEMFQGCTSLTYVECLADTIGTQGVYHMIYDGAATGTLDVSCGMVSTFENANAAPSDWTIQEIAGCGSGDACADWVNMGYTSYEECNCSQQGLCWDGAQCMECGSGDICSDWENLGYTTREECDCVQTGGTWDGENCTPLEDLCSTDPICDCETNQGGTWDYENNICTFE